MDKKVEHLGPERRVHPRPVSSYQKLLDIAFEHARKIETYPKPKN